MPTTLRTVSQRGVSIMERSIGMGRVDRGQGIIYGCKICGLESRNTGRVIGLDPKVFGDAVNKPYSYSAAALQAAIPLYEGASVRINHPRTEMDSSGKRVVVQKERGLFETVGEIKNVHFKSGDGLYGDIHLVRSNSSAPVILEMAERFPSRIALSHNAHGDTKLINGRAVIYEISTVYSVDLVGDKPGTTNGLFECNFPLNTETPMNVPNKTSPAEFSAPKTPTPQLHRVDNGEGDQEREPMVINTESAGDLKRAIQTILSSPDYDLAQQISKIAAIVSNPEAPMMEELYQLRAEKAARELLESRRMETSEDRVKVLARLARQQDRVDVVEQFGRSTTPPRPRTSAPLYESQAATRESDSALRGRELIRAIRAGGVGSG